MYLNDASIKPQLGTPLDLGEGLSIGLNDCWPANEGLGLLLSDLGLMENPLSVVGTGSSWVGSTDGPALRLTSSTYLRSGASPFNPSSTKFTAAIWVNFTSAIANTALITQEDGGGVGRSWLSVSSTSKPSSSIGGTAAAGTTTLVTGVWYRLLVTYNGSSVRVFVNGLPEATATRSAESANGSIRIGANKSGANTLNGLIGRSGVQLWTRVLTDEEISRDYSEPYEIFGTTRNRFYLATPPASDVPSVRRFSVKPSSPALDASHPLASGLQSVWTLHENSGSKIYDISPNRVQGSLNPGVTWAKSPFGPCLSFNGALPGVNVSIPESSAINVGGKRLTVSAWVRPQVAALSGGIIEKTIGGQFNTQFLLFLEGGVPRFRIINNPSALAAPQGSQVTAAADAALPVKEWSRVVGVYDGSRVRLFVDGKAQSDAPSASFSITRSTTATSGNSALIGSLGGIYPFNGAIDLPGIHATAWSHAHVSMDFEDSFAAFRAYGRLYRGLTTPSFVHFPHSAARPVVGRPFGSVA